MKKALPIGQRELALEDIQAIRSALGMRPALESADRRVAKVRAFVTDWLLEHKVAWRKVPARFKKLLDPYEPPIGINRGRRKNPILTDSEELTRKIREAERLALGRAARAARYRPVKKAKELVRRARFIEKRRAANMAKKARTNATIHAIYELNLIRRNPLLEAIALDQPSWLYSL